MKTPPYLLAGACILLLSSCVDPYYAGNPPLHSGGPVLMERQPVLVERRNYVQEQPTVRVDRYSRTYDEPRPFYGDEVPAQSYRRTTTRTYQGY
jgi:hypothetical protein